MPSFTQIQLRRDTAATWTAVNPVLAAGEPGFETDTGKEKRGDGVTAWTALAYMANRSQLAQGGAVIDLYTLYPEDFGGLSALGTASDDTVTMQALVDYIDAQNLSNVAVRLPPSLALNSAPRHDRQGNAILALGQTTTNGKAVTLVAAPGGTSITTTQTGLAYSASFGPPSVIGGPTYEQVGAATFSQWQLNTVGVITLTLPANPSISGIDLVGVGTLDLDQIQAFGLGNGAAQPTNIAFGLRMAGTGSSGINRIKRFGSYQLYAPLVANCSHLHVGEANLTRSVIALAFDQFGTPDGHAAWFDRLLTQACTYHIGGWSPTTGAVSLAGGKTAQISAQWDIEDDAAPWGTTDHILDANNILTGILHFNRNSGGPSASALTLSGAQNIDLWNLVQSGTPTGLSRDGHGNLTTGGSFTSGFAVSLAGWLQYTNSFGARVFSGAGTPNLEFGNNPTAGDNFIDTDGTLGPSDWACTTGGATPVWVRKRGYTGTPNTQAGTTYTFVLTDVGRVVEANNGSPVTFTIPPNASVAYPIGAILRVYTTGAGTLTLAAGAGVTIRGTLTVAQFASAAWRQRATNEWVPVVA